MTEKLAISTSFKIKMLVYALIAIAGLNFLLRISALADWLLPCAGLVLLVYLTFLTLQQDEIYRKKLIVLNILIVSSVVFWTLYMQQFIGQFIYRTLSRQTSLWCATLHHHLLCLTIHLRNFAWTDFCLDVGPSGFQK